MLASRCSWLRLPQASALAHLSLMEVYDAKAKLKDHEQTFDALQARMEAKKKTIVRKAVKNAKKKAVAEWKKKNAKGPSQEEKLEAKVVKEEKIKKKVEEKAAVVAVAAQEKKADEVKAAQKKEEKKADQMAKADAKAAAAGAKP